MADDRTGGGGTTTSTDAIPILLGCLEFRRSTSDDEDLVRIEHLFYGWL
jgi:hypothetical protein